MLPGQGIRIEELNLPDESTTVSPDENRDSAIPKLLDQEGGRLYTLALRLCGGPESAEDLVQEIFLKAYTGWGAFRGGSSPRTWLYTIAAHACQRMKRKRAGEPDVVRSLEDLLPIESETMVDLDQLQSRPENDASQERQESIEQAITELDDDFRLPLVLKDIVGLPMTTIAAILDLKEGTVKTRVHRARLKIREALAALLPQKKSVPLAYPKQVLLDLLEAKQAALDREIPFRMDDIICERCEALFRTMDLAENLCRNLSRGNLPGQLRGKLLQRIQGE